LSRHVEDPRRSVSDYTKGPKFGKKKLRPALDRIRWTWDEHYIGPGPPSQIIALNLSPLTTESEILMNFKAFGEIQHFELKTDPATGGSLGVCSIIFRDSKSAKTLGHQSAKRAVQQGNDLRLGMQNIRVMLDRDGLRYGKYTKQLLDNKKRKAEEARKKEEEQAARNRPPPTAPHTDAAAAPKPWNPPQRDVMLPRDLDDRFLKPKPPNYKAINELGRRPAVFISSRWIPGEARFCKHLFGRLKNFGVDNILCDRDGFFVVFYNMRGLNSCFRMCDGDRLFSYKMCMKPYPHGNPALGPVSLDGNGTKSGSPHREPVRKLERTRVARETTNEILTDLRTALRSDTIKRVADPCIYDALEPDRLANRKKTESQGKTDGVTREIAPGTSSVLASIFATHKPPGGRQATITALPRFRKRPARQETPKLAKEARPLAHMLNNYNDASDDESTITEHRPVSRGSASRALSTDIGDDDSASVATSLADIRNRKRKRSHGARTPSRLKDTALETDDEQDEEGQVAGKVQEDLMDVDEEAGPTVVDDFIAASDEDTESNRKRSRIMEDQGKAEGEDEEVDILGNDSNDLEILRHSEDQWKGDYVQPIIKIDNDQDAPAIVLTEPKLSWTISTTDRPRPPVEDDHQVILDLDGLQSMLKDYEDLLFLRRAVEHEPKADIFNVHAWAWKIKEVKATNREGMRGVYFFCRILGQLEPAY
jgi:histone-lysine N-methyltransferase SETD1